MMKKSDLFQVSAAGNLDIKPNPPNSAAANNNNNNNNNNNSNTITSSY